MPNQVTEERRCIHWEYWKTISTHGELRQKPQKHIPPPRYSDKRGYNAPEITVNRDVYVALSDGEYVLDDEGGNL